MTFAAVMLIICWVVLVVYLVNRIATLETRLRLRRVRVTFACCRCSRSFPCDLGDPRGVSVECPHCGMAHACVTEEGT